MTIAISTGGEYLVLQEDDWKAKVVMYCRKSAWASRDTPVLIMGNPGVAAVETQRAHSLAGVITLPNGTPPARPWIATMRGKGEKPADGQEKVVLRGSKRFAS